MASWGPEFPFSTQRTGDQGCTRPELSLTKPLRKPFVLQREMCAVLPRRPQGSVHEGESAGSSVAGGRHRGVANNVAGLPDPRDGAVPLIFLNFAICWYCSF